MSEQTSITCVATGVSINVKRTPRGNLRLPTGWKRIGGQPYSKKGWQQRFHLSAVIVPIAGLDTDESELNEKQIKAQRREGWKQINETMKDCWSKTTELANWANIELLKADQYRDPETGKLAKLETVSLYSMRKGTFDGWSQSANAVIRTVEQTYRQLRGEMLGFGRRRLPDVRYPYPYPVHKDACKLTENDGRFSLSFPTPKGRLNVVLLGGNRYRRQSGRLRQLIDGTAIAGEASIYRKGKETLVKIVGYFPRKAGSEQRSGKLHVRTDWESFIVALNDKDERLFVINGDRFKKTVVKHKRWQQRFREDQKMEERQPRRVRKSRLTPMQDGSDKFLKRQDSFVKERAAQIVNYAKRRRLSEITYDDSDRRFFGDNFPYYIFEQRIVTLCDEAGIRFTKRECSSDEKDTATARKE